jgi:hypothetical protein
MRLRRRARQAIVRLVGELVEEPPDAGRGGAPAHGRRAGLAGSVRRDGPLQAVESHLAAACSATDGLNWWPLLCN